MGKELTVRGLIIGVFITLVFTAANVYFGLKAGLTFSTSIPAAVISMALLRGFRDATVQENNIVQTVASAAGTLSSIIFVLPGLIMIGWWTGFPFWISFLICALGGVLGVMYSIPLRRALVTNSDLPYPEGVACAEVLKVGSTGDKEHAADIEHGRAGLLAVMWGSIVAAAFAIIVATQVFASDVAQTFRIGRRGGVSGYDFSLSFALLAIGHLCGLSVGIAMLIGTVIGWGWLVPHYSALTGDLTTAAGALAQTTWSQKVRFIGAGAIGVSAIWTLLKLVKPVATGLAGAMAASRARKAGKADSLPITERDIPIGIVGLVTLLCMLPIGWVLGYFANTSGLGAHVTTLVIGGVFYVILMSFFVSAVCGYMAGLIGSSNSPLSGIGILVVIGAAVLLVFGVKPYAGPEATKALMAFALFTTAVIFNVAAIANNNLQDLKTGQLVDATPWKQQVALIIGVLAGAVVIPPVLNLVNQAYGFVGAPGAELRPSPLASAAGGSDLVPRPRSDRGQHRLEPDPNGRLHRCRYHRARRHPGPLHETHARPTTRGRTRHLSADCERPHDRGRHDRGLVLRPRRRSHAESGRDEAARRLARLGFDRRRKHHRSGDLRDCRFLRSCGTTLARRPRISNACHYSRRGCFRLHRFRAFSLDPADGDANS